MPKIYLDEKGNLTTKSKAFKEIELDETSYAYVMRKGKYDEKEVRDAGLTIKLKSTEKGKETTRQLKIKDAACVATYLHLDGVVVSKELQELVAAYYNCQQYAKKLKDYLGENLDFCMLFTYLNGSVISVENTTFEQLMQNDVMTCLKILDKFVNKFENKK